MNVFGSGGRMLVRVVCLGWNRVVMKNGCCFSFIVWIVLLVF